MTKPSIPTKQPPQPVEPLPLDDEEIDGRVVFDATASMSESTWSQELVGRRIRELLRLRGMSQAELAHSTGMSRPVINRILKGERKIRAEQLVAISKALRLAPASLLPQAETVEEIQEYATNVFGGSVLRRPPQSLQDFLAAHESDITKREGRLLRAIANELPDREVELEIKPDFWRRFLDLWRECVPGL